MVKKVWQAIKSFFYILKEYAVYILTGIAAIFLFIYRKKLQTFATDFFQDKTDTLREQKEQNDKEKNKTYKATKTGETDKSVIPKRNQSTKKTTESLIERNRKHIERLKNEK